MKGIILAGGTGSRLWPSTISLSKQLIPIFDKPLIYYPLSTLMLAGIREILIITTEEDQNSFIRLLGDGNKFGVNLHYETQKNPEGLAQAFLIGKEFIEDGNVALILGDNIFHGSGLGGNLAKCTNPNGALIFGYEVSEPQRYGVAEIDSSGCVISIEEKPNSPKSDLAIPGLYFFDKDIFNICRNLKPSARGELEITDAIKEYLSLGKLSVIALPLGTAWLDMGSYESLLEAGEFVHIVQSRQGILIGDPMTAMRSR